MHGTAPGEVMMPLASFGGLVALVVPESLPEGASPRTYNGDYLVGQAKTRDGLRSVYNSSQASIGPNVCGLGTSSTWATPDGIEGTSSFSNSPVVTVHNSINAQEFAFSINESLSVSGLLLNVFAKSSAPVTVSAQLLINGIPAGEIKSLTVNPLSPGIIAFGSLTDFWGLGSLTNAQVNATTFGVQFTASISGGFSGAQAFLQNAQITLGVNTAVENTQPLETWTAQNGQRYNLVMDSGGNLSVEALDTAPGVLSLSRSGIQPSLALQCMGTGVDFLAFMQPGTLGGNDMPLQWTPTSQNRITQVGPGAAPIFTPTQASDVDFPILSITQPPAAVDPNTSAPYTFIYFLQSAGPGSNTPGNIVTIYYADSTNTPQNADLVTAFNSGQPVYIYVDITGIPTPFGPLVVQVTGVGEAQPPDQPRNFFYFTFIVSSTEYTYFQGNGHPGYTAAWQRTLATLTTSAPVPNAQVGSQLVVTGVTPSNWDNTWTLTQTPNASEMVITGSQVAAGTATFNYAVTNGSANPAVGELVTITNTLNAGGQLNVTNNPIASVSGGATGTFTVAGYPGTLTAPFRAENGLADTAGTIFNFDPGAGLVDTATNPIFGNASAGGDVVFNPTGIFIDPGTYQGTMFAILPDGSYTQPAPPVVFTVPDNTTGINVSGMLIGPNWVGRGIAITEAGQNGVPGANFFTITNPVIFYNQGSQLTATSFLVNDNTTVNVDLFFTSAVLNRATAIDIYGYNLFNCFEIADPAWIVSYSSRNWYGQCLNRIQNLINMSFDGGFPQSSGRLVPAGWMPQDTFGTLVNSPRFGNAWFIQNTTGSTISGPIGLISQGAYQDANLVNIIQPNTGYSARVWARTPSGATVGDLVVSLVAGSNVIGSLSIPLSSMATSYNRFIDVVLADPGVISIPTNVQISVGLIGSAAGADVEIDRIDLFDTDIPVLTNTVFASYAGLPTMVDAVTGQVVFASENQQPVQMATVLYDTFYAMKGWSGTAPGSSLYSLQESSGFEPADWNEPEVSQRSGGAVGPFAWDGGEQWFVGASRPGLYLFVGGQPGKIMQELQPIWDSINWKNAQAVSSIAVDIDLNARRMLVGVPLATPNFWLPNAPVNANPTAPNVWMMCNFQGLDTGEELRGEPQVHTTMFGTLSSIDMRRKWNIWYSATNPGTVARVQGLDGEETRFGNGILSSKVYKLDPTMPNDDGFAIDSLYTTSGFPLLSKRAEMAQLGYGQVRTCYLFSALTTGGLVNLRMMANRLFFPEPDGYVQWTVPGGFTPGLQPLNDVESSANFPAMRNFIEFRQNDGLQGWTLSNVNMKMRADVWNKSRGSKT